MARKTCVIEVNVLAHWLIQRFSGEAVLAAADPRYVVALLIKDTKAPFAVKDTEVTFSAHRVAFFAIGSITRVFGDGDVVGKDFRLAVTQEEVNGKTIYAISLEE